MLTLSAFLLAIGLLVTIHEYGHYRVARACGVQVLTFSIGFGPILLRWRRGETVWQLCAVPLGGYVQMQEGRADQPKRRGASAFDEQPVLARMAIVAAGPVANLLFAVAAYWLLAGVGQTVALPKVGAVVPDSPAAVAGLVPGDRITRLGERRVDTWSALHLALIAHGQQAGPIEVTVERADGASRVYVLDPRMVSQEVFAHDPLGALGVSFLPYRPVLSAVLLDGAAARAGLRAGDRLLTVSGQPVRDWAMFAEMIRRHPGQSLRVEVQRGARMLAFTLTPSALTERGRTIGRIGAVPEIDAQALAAAQTYQRLGLIDGLRSALGRTWDTTVLSFRLFGRLLTGELSVRQLSGPVAIADHAGQSAARGWTDYLAFLALVSISIAVLNLLPIPVLDGGHLLYHAAELLRGRPLPDWVRQVGHRVGFGVLMVLTALALFNDLTRLAS